MNRPIGKYHQAVLFDVDGVLLDSIDANIAFYQELFRQAGLPALTAAEFGAQNHLSVPAMLRQTQPGMADEQVAEVVALADTINAGYVHLRLPPQVVEVVSALAENYRLGVVTNRSRIGVDELWKFSGLGKYFSARAAYEDTANHKPDPEPVRYALDQVQIEPGQAVFIGDALTDLQAAQAAGVKFIMFGQTLVPVGIPTATKFHELPELIARTLGGA